LYRESVLRLNIYPGCVQQGNHIHAVLKMRASDLSLSHDAGLPAGPRDRALGRGIPEQDEATGVSIVKLYYDVE
jgi:hypothetical protein